MGRRTRKRVVTGAAARASVAPGAVTAPPHARTPDRRAPSEEAPKAPWAPLPLVEGCILVGIVLIVAAFAGGGDRRGLLAGCGFALVSLAALELAVREHLAGYRSHSALLAGALAVAVAAAAYLLTELPQAAILVVAVVVGGVALPALREVFRRRSGGLGFRA
jgi:hypothetical protein